MKQREPREECPAFLAFVRRRPCCVCTAPAPSQAAHLRMACPERDKRSTGMGEKPHDRWAVPLCQGCHLDDPEAQHRGSEAAFWQRAEIDPFEIAEKLWRTFERRQSRPPEVRKKVRERAVRIKRAVKAKPHASVSRAKLRGPKRKWKGAPFAKTAKKVWPKRSFS